MKKISKRDLTTLKAGLAYYEKDPEDYHCEKCPMSYTHNRLRISCCDFIELLGGEDIWERAANEGYESQHDVIKYLIKINPSRIINI